jgi:hypothetical protein
MANPDWPNGSQLRANPLHVIAHRRKTKVVVGGRLSQSVTALIERHHTEDLRESGRN